MPSEAPKLSFWQNIAASATAACIAEVSEQAGGWLQARQGLAAAALAAPAPSPLEPAVAPTQLPPFFHWQAVSLPFDTGEGTSLFEMRT